MGWIPWAAAPAATAVLVLILANVWFGLLVQQRHPLLEHPDLPSFLLPQPHSLDP